jgi:ubiquitin-conjugating enzyme E2 A
MAVRRLQQDFRQLLKNKVEGIDASPSSDNFFVWNAIICGPEESIYESGAFQLQFTFPEDYPLKPPQVRFLTKVYHPNVWWEDGLICVDILKDGWTPSYDVLAILHSIRLLLIDPNPLSPANLEAALLYRDNRAEYNRRVLEMIQDTLDTDDEEAEDEGEDNESDDDDEDDDDDDDDDGDDDENENEDDTAQVEEGDILRQKSTILRDSITE